MNGITEGCRERQLVYLGPTGSQTEEAALAFAERLKICASGLRAMGNVPAALESVASGEAAWAVVPGENSTEGSVNMTWDFLLTHEGLAITGELSRPIRHCLLAQRGTKLSDIAAVLSHPQALAQCRDFLSRRLGAVKQYETASTAEAARVVSVNQLPLAAVGSERAGQAYGLDVLVSDIQDLQDNTTRFLLVTLGDEGLPPPTGHDRTSLVCAADRDRPGSLRDLLAVFADRGLNLLRIESRPARRSLGEYVFFLDVEGHVDEPAVAQALAALSKESSVLKVLGSYPRSG